MDASGRSLEKIVDDCRYSVTWISGGTENAVGQTIRPRLCKTSSNECLVVVVDLPVTNCRDILGMRDSALLRDQHM